MGISIILQLTLHLIGSHLFRAFLTRLNGIWLGYAEQINAILMVVYLAKLPDVLLTEYCRSVTIVTKTKTTFFTRKIDQFHLKTGQFRHFFEVKNVVNFSNSSRQYSVKQNLLYLPLFVALIRINALIPSATSIL